MIADEASDVSFLELERQAASAAGSSQQQRRSSSAIARARDEEEARVREAMAALDALEMSQSFGGSFVGAAAASADVQSPVLGGVSTQRNPHHDLTTRDISERLLVVSRRIQRRSVVCS